MVDLRDKTILNDDDTAAIKGTVNFNKVKFLVKVSFLLIVILRIFFLTFIIFYGPKFLLLSSICLI